MNLSLKYIPPEPVQKRDKTYSIHSETNTKDASDEIEKKISRIEEIKGKQFWDDFILVAISTRLLEQRIEELGEDNYGNFWSSKWVSLY